MILIWKIKRILRALTFYAYTGFICGIPFYSIRNAYIRKILKISLGKDVAVLMGVTLIGSKISIGDRSVINNRVTIDGRFGV